MFDKFGEFDSVEELNRTAEGLKEEGDKTSLLELAEENGIDREDAEAFMNGEEEALANELMAALGKLEVEKKQVKHDGIMEDWITYIQFRCKESKEVARAVRKKGKSLAGCIAALLHWSFKHQIPVDKEIMKAAGVKAGRCTLGIPGMGTAKKIITEYYLGK